ncbi:MAG: hypothetical protein PHW29_04350 [Flavobacterium sp.]|nr:hypothetical protein [Flavobacterium sp.]
MNKTEITNINKKNKALVKLLKEITQCEVEYNYHYEKGHWVNGYDGEPGFQVEDHRSGRLYIVANDQENIITLCSLYGANNSHQKDFRIFTIDEVYNYVKEQLELFPNSKHKLYIKMMFDNYFDKKTEKKAKVKV